MLWRDPTFLWLLIAVGALAAFVAVGLRRRSAALRGFADAGLIGRLAPAVDRRRRAGRAALRVAALVLLVLALAGPKWGFHWEEVRREGIDLIVAVDTSRSMLATDVAPNRLERAKLAILDLVKLLEGDRVGLVAFAGTAFLECPLTLDYAAFERSLRSVDAGLIPRGGTALARAIDTSLEAFEARQGKYEALILITDGEDHEGNVKEAAQRAADRGVKVYTVGIGTAEGELIPLGNGGGQSFVKDRQGQVVKSRLDEETLEEIAATTQGAYVRGLGAALGLDQVFRDHIAKMERRDVGSSLERRYEERFQIPLGLALLLLLLESLVPERKPSVSRARGWRRLLDRRRKGAGARSSAGSAATPLLGAVLLLGLLPGLTGWLDPQGNRTAEGNRLYEAGKYSEAGERYGAALVDTPASPVLQFNLAAALYKQGKFAEAINSLNKVLSAEDPAWSARAAYNLGNAQYRLGANAESSDPQAALASYEQALASYRRAMGADPHDDDAKFNHEFVAKKLAELKKRIEEQEQEQQQEEQEQQEQEPQEQEPQEQPEQGENQEQEQQPPEQDQAGEQEQPQQDQPSEEQQQAEPEPEEQPGQEQEQPQPGQADQEGAAEQQGAGPAEQEPEPESADEQAAQAVLDTARGEELGPEDVQRPAGAAGLVEPLQDW